MCSSVHVGSALFTSLRKGEMLNPAGFSPCWCSRTGFLCWKLFWNAKCEPNVLECKG